MHTLVPSHYTHAHTCTITLHTCTHLYHHTTTHAHTHTTSYTHVHSSHLHTTHPPPTYHTPPNYKLHTLLPLIIPSQLHITHPSSRLSFPLPPPTCIHIPSHAFQFHPTNTFVLSPLPFTLPRHHTHDGSVTLPLYRYPIRQS